MKCTICDSNKLSKIFKNKNLIIYKCKRCTHIFSEHLTKFIESDYHQQDDNSPFIQSLKRTRLEQAQVILKELSSFQSKEDLIFDFGCGRGWFLNSAKKDNFINLYGADYSSIAVEKLKDSKINSIKVTEQDINESYLNFHKNLNIKITTLLFLDVIEHFESKNYFEVLENLITKSNSKSIIIKVPDSKGIFFRLSRLFAFFGVHNPLEQLFQVNSYPPHFQYFNEKSFQILAKKLSLSILKIIPDKDINIDETFFDRIQFRFFFPKSLLVIALKIVMKFLIFLGFCDSKIYILKPDKV
jgi:hypothetical protein